MSIYETSKTQPAAKSKATPDSRQGLLIFVCIASFTGMVIEPSAGIQAAIIGSAAFVSIFLLQILKVLHEINRK